MPSLVGSEMCIRDSVSNDLAEGSSGLRYRGRGAGPSTLSAHASQTDRADSDPDTDGKKIEKKEEIPPTIVRGRHLNKRVLVPMYIAGWKQWPTEPRRGDKLRPQISKHTFGAAESQAGSGSTRARLPDGESLSRPPTALFINNGMQKKKNSVRTILTHVLDKYCCTSSRAFAPR